MPERIPSRGLGRVKLFSASPSTDAPPVSLRTDRLGRLSRRPGSSRSDYPPRLGLDLSRGQRWAEPGPTSQTPVGTISRLFSSPTRARCQRRGPRLSGDNGRSSTRVLKQSWSQRFSDPEPNRSSRALKGLIGDVPDLSITVLVIAKAPTRGAQETTLQSPIHGPPHDRSGNRVAGGRTKPPTDLHTRPSREACDPVWRRPTDSLSRTRFVQLINMCWDSAGENPRLSRTPGLASGSSPSCSKPGHPWPRAVRGGGTQASRPTMSRLLV